MNKMNALAVTGDVRPNENESKSNLEVTIKTLIINN
jgi:hypothetical protein